MEQVFNDRSCNRINLGRCAISLPSDRPLRAIAFQPAEECPRYNQVTGDHRARRGMRLSILFDILCLLLEKASGTGRWTLPSGRALAIWLIGETVSGLAKQKTVYGPLYLNYLK